MLTTKDDIKKGDRFGKLIVTSESLTKGTHKFRKVICDCGQEKEIWEHNLLTTVSCGCAVGEKFEPLFELPEPQKNKKHKVARGGKLLVVEDQTIYRIKGKLLYRCAVSRTGRGYRYDQVTYQEGGKQKHETVHRLMAEAFIPNPENKPQVNHIDGDPSNNSIDNLEWVTAKENIQHAYETGLIRTLDNTPYKCIKCEKPTMNDNEVCRSCKNEMSALKNRLKSKLKQRNRFKNIDAKQLKPRYRKIVRSRFRGDTLKEIGDRWGVTREYIRQLEKRIFDEEPIIYKERKLGGEYHKEKKERNLSITIKAARINADKKAGEVAQLVGVTKGTLYNWEKYKNKIPFETFLELCSLYNISSANICGHKNGGWFVPEKYTGADNRKEKKPCKS